MEGLKWQKKTKKT